MKRIINLLFCCGALINMVGCGGNTAPPPTESPPIPVSKTIITEPTAETAPPTTAAEPPEKEKESVLPENKEQTTKPTATTTEPITTTQTTEETKTAVTSTAEEKLVSPIEETVPSIILQFTEHETTQPEFNIHYWITFAKEYAVSIGLTLDSTAVYCWDNPIRAGTHCIYLERDIQSRLNSYAKDEDITDVWIWAESTDNDCYDIYIGYT